MTRAPLVELTVRVFDRGPEPDWHKDRRYFSAWAPFGATLALPGEEAFASAVGWTPREAIIGVVSAKPVVANAMREAAP